MEDTFSSKCWSYLRKHKAVLAELLATFLLVTIGDGVVAVNTLRRLEGNSVVVGAFGWGLAVTVAVTIAGQISGGHANPAVTLAVATVKKCAWRNVLPYMAAQYVGAFLGSAVVYLVYHDAIKAFDGGMRQVLPQRNSTAEIFACYPQEFASTMTCFWDQVVGTGLLLITGSAAMDERNMNVPPFGKSLIIGLGLTTIILAFGYNCMAPLNPARDLSPRIFTALFGWGSDVFTFRDYNWFWVPIVGPHIGAIVGVWIYRICVELHHEEHDRLENLESRCSIADHTFSGEFESNQQKPESEKSPNQRF